MKEYRVTLPLARAEIEKIKAGDYVYLTGELLTARDAAHARMQEALREGEDLPIAIAGETIYYLGPTPAREGQVIGSAGPTTSSRMDAYTPQLMDLGLVATIGKGKRSPAVIESIVRNGGAYFAAVGGAGALLSKCIKEAKVIAYEDLGTEAIRRLRVEDFPVICIVDSEGNNWYEMCRKHR